MEAVTGTAVGAFGEHPSVSVETEPHLVAKRAVDLTVSAVLILLLAVPMLLAAIAIRLTSRGPALFRQVRVGRDGEEFVMLKFRSMRNGSDDGVHREYVSRMLTGGRVPPGVDPHAPYKLSHDDRVTPFGTILRKTSLDELPQLFNVVAGTMSLVGPRPPLPWEAELFEPRHLVRFKVKPGITGLWQVNGRSTMTMAEALDLDVQYVEEQTFWLDLSILVRTIPVVLSCRGAS